MRTTSGLYTPEFVDDIRRVAREGDESRGIEPIDGARVIPRQLAMGPPVDAPVARSIEAMVPSLRGIRQLCFVHAARPHCLLIPVSQCCLPLLTSSARTWRVPTSTTRSSVTETA